MDPSRTPASHAPAWKLLLVDDDPEVHAVTQLVLGNFRFQDHPLEILSATSEAEARQLLAEHADIAVVFLDVVMEHDRSGLLLVEHIRRELGNHDIRIVLRTGQPGQAPEQDVVSRYDINDYREKTELTAQKLYTTLFAALRGWRDIQTIRASKRGLERVISASARTFGNEHHDGFRTTVLAQLDRLVEGASTLCVAVDNRAPALPLTATAATGRLRDYRDSPLRDALPAHQLESLQSALDDRAHRFADDHYVLYFRDSASDGELLFLGQVDRLSELDHKLLELFASNVSIALKNLDLTQDLTDAQMEMIFLLAGAAESRSHETAAHVSRVGLVAELLAHEYGLDDATCERIRHAAPLHDIGKIGTPDAILNKPGGHTPEETVVMRQHAEIGHRMLATSKRAVLQLAAEIALTHHERWDGGGYPRGLAGEAIPVSGRITMLADVFDALGSQRCYKDAWPAERIRGYIVENSGAMFDPTLTRILLQNWSRAEAIRARLPD
ncbi:MAG: DUF3369 domain-containing protein [Lysobacter sp.]